ncbi:hypothetical protein A1O3_01739 [Capronia epimyces CBS 606.96]|uniref:Uncharacterized protein n=1 Tax=Capronia epimyces CBS 606.96 TaxID=1182542 RepID=W9YJV1_9EURO|nr:uncharacterized protein A1O3_01739 [Capronia epimyces CBS 606.96]EXJ93182.1 hypothetical protein A1O3_01739 [Capronia epimyces CBS 606.96]
MKTTHLAWTLLLFAATALSIVIPIPARNPDREHYPNVLHQLNHMQPTNSLMCRLSHQSMSCYGGPAVTLQTCQATCTCDNGRISCPSYKYCDDSTMDTFCGGLCQCGAPASARPKINKEAEIVMSPHHYSPPRAPFDDDDDDSDDDDEESLRQKRQGSW